MSAFVVVVVINPLPFLPTFRGTSYLAHRGNGGIFFFRSLACRVLPWLAALPSLLSSDVVPLLSALSDLLDTPAADSPGRRFLSVLGDIDDVDELPGCCCCGDAGSAVPFMVCCK